MHATHLNSMRFYKNLSQNFNLIDFQCKTLVQPIFLKRNSTPCNNLFFKQTLKHHKHKNNKESWNEQEMA